MSPATISEGTRCDCGHDWGQHAPATDGRQSCIAYVPAKRLAYGASPAAQHGGIQPVKGFGLMNAAVLCPCGDFMPADDRDELDGLALDREVDRRLGR